MTTEHLHHLATTAGLTLHTEGHQRFALTDPYGVQVSPDAGLDAEQVEAVLVERVAPLREVVTA
jgi:hypothetical protein